MNVKGKRVLVTGAGGFIGSHLVEALVSRGADVKAFVRYNSRNDWGMLEHIPSVIRENLDVTTGDITDSGLIKKAVKNCDIIFHLAALIGIPYSYVAPESYVNTNIKGTMNIMQASLEEGVKKIVHTSTSEVYGTDSNTFPSMRSILSRASHPTLLPKSGRTCSPTAISFHSIRRLPSSGRSIPLVPASQQGQSYQPSSPRHCQETK